MWGIEFEVLTVIFLEGTIDPGETVAVAVQAESFFIDANMSESIPEGPEALDSLCDEVDGFRKQYFLHFGYGNFEVLHVYFHRYALGCETGRQQFDVETVHDGRLFLITPLAIL